jgi:predicted lipoprotein with Yx(FWY)xxD motif
MALQRRAARTGVTSAGPVLAGLALAGLALAGPALAGCGARNTVLPSGLDEGDGYGKPVGGVAPSAPPGDGVPGDGTPAAITSLRIYPAGPLGDIIADNAGRTLYRYDGDGARPSTSACTGECAQVWPPVRWNPELRVAGGIERERIGRIRRPDGTLQLTLAGIPLYRYSRDTGPGDVNGQGVTGGWSAIRADGTKAAFAKGIPPPPGYGAGTGGVVNTESPEPPRTQVPPGSPDGG